MPFEQVNGKVVRATVTPQNAVLARRGAMLGLTGDVVFRPVRGQGGGAAGMLGAAVSGESNPMMATTGTGTVLYGLRGMSVTVLDLDGQQPLTVEADRLLAHDADLQTSLQFLGSGGIRGAVRGAATGQGLFTTQVSGRGSVALLSHGGTFALTVTPGQPVGVDPQAYVAHVGQLSVDLKARLGWRDAVGKGSGEAFQLQVTGSGTVYVQASEKKL
jgi:uncharacterized protein (AIM24 family)